MLRRRNVLLFIIVQMHLETILTNFINVRFKRPAVRCYEIENLYEYEPEKPVTPKVKKGGIIGKRKG